MQKPIEDVKPGDKISLWAGFLPPDNLITSIEDGGKKITLIIDRDGNEPLDFPKGTIVEVEVKS